MNCNAFTMFSCIIFIVNFLVFIDFYCGLIYLRFGRFFGGGEGAFVVPFGRPDPILTLLNLWYITVRLLLFLQDYG